MVHSQNHSQQHQDIIASCPYNDLIRRTVHSSCLIEVAADGAAEAVLALRITGPE